MTSVRRAAGRAPLRDELRDNAHGRWWTPVDDDGRPREVRHQRKQGEDRFSIARKEAVPPYFAAGHGDLDSRPVSSSDDEVWLAYLEHTRELAGKLLRADDP